MKHPDEALLALYAGGDLGLAARCAVAVHLARCPCCRAAIAGFRAARKELSRMAAETPAGWDWDRLAAEMRANIRVGLVAGECVEPAPARRPGWRPAAALATVILVLAAGLWVQRPRAGLERTAWVDGALLEATAGAIQLREGDGTLSLRHPEAGDVTYLVNVEGALRARYVDAETDQVTIQNLYVE